MIGVKLNTTLGSILSTVLTASQLIKHSHLVHDVLVSVFGKDWRNQVGSKMDVVPMLAGTSHDEVLAGCIPYDEAELAEAVTS